jgi:PTS system ascorbate-specific IIA component
MSTGLLLITHGKLGQDMLDTVTEIMCQCPLQVKTIRVGSDCNPDAEFAAASEACEELDQGNGTLILTDLYGSTPSNIAARLLERFNTRVISGVNVPMLLRILNYPDASLDKLAEIAVEGAHNGVIISTRKQAS